MLTIPFNVHNEKMWKNFIDSRFKDTVYYLPLVTYDYTTETVTTTNLIHNLWHRKPKQGFSDKLLLNEEA